MKFLNMATIFSVGFLIGLYLPRADVSSPSSEAVAGAQKPQSSFNDLLDAIEWVESKGDANAVGDNGKAVGAFQIHKIYIDDLNRIYKSRHTDKFSTPIRWSDFHRKSKVCSRLMVRDYLRHYATAKRIGREPTLEDMARIHNGGPTGYKKESTKKYWQKIKSRLETQNAKLAK